MSFYLDVYSSKPVQCALDMPYGLYVKNVKQEELKLDNALIKISKVEAPTVITRSNFTEIKKSKIKHIEVTGDLFLHDCTDIIDKVTVNGFLVLFRCHVRQVFATTGVKIYYHENDSLKDYSYPAINSLGAVNQVVLTSNIQDALVYENSNVKGTLYVDENYKTLIIKGSCSIDTIHFEGTKFKPDERVVIVKRDAEFKGQVVGGTLIYEAFS